MKKLFFALSVCLIFASCTKDLGSLNTLSTQDVKPYVFYELALKQQSFTSSSLEACVDLALNSVPNSAFLKNAKVSSKGKNLTVVADVWVVSKKQPEKNPELYFDKFTKRKGMMPDDFSDKFKFEVGMPVKWVRHPNGKGHGIISKIYEDIAFVDKVIDKDGNPAKPLKLPLQILKPNK